MFVAGYLRGVSVGTVVWLIWAIGIALRIHSTTNPLDLGFGGLRFGVQGLGVAWMPAIGTPNFGNPSP